MIRKTSRDAHRIKIHKRLRRKLSGSAERPRMAVYRSLKHIYVQVIDDERGHTLLSLGTRTEGIEGLEKGGNIKAAEVVGAALAQKAREQGIEKVVFDRGGRRYHGRVKALADAARKAGLEF